MKYLIYTKKIWSPKSSQVKLQKKFIKKRYIIECESALQIYKNRFKILRTRHDKTYQYRFLINKQKNEFKKIEKAIELKNERFLTQSQRSFRKYVERKY